MSGGFQLINYLEGILCASTPSCQQVRISVIIVTNRYSSAPRIGQRNGSRPQSFYITGQRETLQEASLLFTVHLMHLTTQDQHELRLDPIKVPSPHFKESYTFQLSVGFSIS